MMLLSAQAQKIYSEEEINQERMFLDAYAKKILGKYDEAISIYEELYKDSPGSHAAAYELARIFEHQEDLQEAIRWMKLAQTGDPANIYYQEFLAELFQKGGRFSEAADLYETLAKQEGGDYYYHRWAFFLVRANEIDDAIKVYDELEKKVGINEEIVRRKHALYLGKGDTKKAARELENLVSAFPETVEYHHQLAAFYEQVGNKKEAQDVYQKILGLDPDNAEAQMALAGRTVKSSNELQYLSSLTPAFEQEDVEMDLKISKLLPFIQKVAETGDRDLADAALALTAVLERVHPDDAKGFAAAGDLFFHSGRWAGAREKYDQALSLDDSVYPVWEQLAASYLLEGDYVSLVKVTNEGIDLFPNKAKLYYLNGLAELELGQFRDAQDMLDQAVLMSGRDQELKLQVLGVLGEAYTALGEYEDADRIFAEAMELNDQSPEILARYSLSLSARSGTEKRATDLAQQALKIARENPLAMRAQAKALYQKGDYGKAREVLQQILDTAGATSPLVLEEFGDVLYQLGEADEALDYWQKAREQGRQTRTLEKKINDRKI
jgi:tetratricopeptide (TPR) repeat protein